MVLHQPSIRKKRKESYQDRSVKIAQTRRMRSLWHRIRSFMWRTMMVATVGVLLLGMVTGRWRDISPVVEQMWFGMTVRMGIRLENVYLDGVNHLDQDVIFYMLPSSQGDLSLFAIDIDELRRQISTIGWIKRAEIERHFPNTLHIRITERTPFAIWQYQGDLALIDAQGTVITHDNIIANFHHLPIFVGENAHYYGGALLTLMRDIDPSLSERIASMVYVGGRRWNVRLNNGIEIKLPEDEPEAAWRYLSSMHREKQLLHRDIQSVDLRVKDKVFIKEK